MTARNGDPTEARTIGEALARTAQTHANDIAIASLDQCLTYAELEQASAAVARMLLARGHAPARNCGLVASGIPYIVAYFGIVRAGNRAVPIEARFRGEQLRHILDCTGVDVVLTDGTGRDSLATLPPGRIQLVEIGPPTTDSAPTPLPEIAPQAELCVLFSSGSTGLPKGVVLTHEAALARAALMARVFGPGKRHLVFTPLAYAYGLIDGILCPLLHGGQTLLLGSYNPARLKQMVQRFDPEVMLGVPFIYRHLSAMAVDLLADFARSAECLYVTTGEPLPSAVRQAFADRYKAPIRQSYGLSETSGIAADLYDITPRPSRVGKLIPGVEIRLVDSTTGSDAPMGEVWVKQSVRFMKGYVAGTETGASRMQGDYYRTGDIARIDEDGYVELFGRNDDFINVAGVRIHPAEIENVLLSIPGVLEAAFICTRAETGTTSTRAYVVLDAAQPVSLGDMDAKLRAELPPSRWPQRIEISAGLPRTDTGKLSRVALIEGKDQRLVATAPVHIESAGRTIAGRLVEVSGNGCAALVEEALPIGARLRLWIDHTPNTVIEGSCRAQTVEGTGNRIAVDFSPDCNRGDIETLIASR